MNAEGNANCVMRNEQAPERFPLTHYSYALLPPICVHPVPFVVPHPLRALCVSAVNPDRALLDLDGGALLFELGLEGLGLFLRDAFLDRLRSAVDQVLRLL